MNSSSQQPELLPALPALSGSTMVNHHVCVQTEGNQRLILVHGIVFSHYSTQDRAAEPTPWLPFSNRDTPIRTISLARSARRCQQRLQAGGLRALARRLGKYLIDYTNKDLATKGTINRTIIEQSIRSCQILTHTGGTAAFSVRSLMSIVRSCARCRST